jgi:ABC-type polysaccharide/polyol phosphate transport system ATPase subunit
VNAVEFQSVSKSYAIYASPGDRLKELATFHRKAFHRDFWALRDLSFTIEKGETFCVIGENGAGKSTLLQLVAGILQPTEGTVRIAGRVSALLELGSGFNPEFTGRDNVYLNGAILGFSTRQIDSKYKQIGDFAEIGVFMDRPIKTYSSGMVMRLAFAVAIHADPDILLVDEALAVGDVYFRQKCMRKVHEMRSGGITILFVSHATGDVRAIGDRTLWLEQGRARELGDTDTVVTRYLEAAARKDAVYSKTQKVEFAPADHIPNVDHRFGDGRAHVTGIAVLNEHGEPVSLLQPSSRVIVRLGLRAEASVQRPVVGFMLRNHLGIDFSGTDTSREGLELPSLTPGQALTVDFHLDLPELYPGFFSFSPAIADGVFERPAMCDWIDNALTVQVGAGGGPIYGYTHFPCRVELNRKLPARASTVEAIVD